MSNRLSGAQHCKWRISRVVARNPFLSLGLAILLAACSSDPELGSPGYVQGFTGGVVADEPYAALVGRDILAAGGSAADAAAATFFALGVTKPASVGLMAQGYCLDYNAADLTHRAYVVDSPAGVRTMAAIHARTGRLPWRQVVGPAEALARFEHKRSLAFVDDWQAAAPSDPAAQAVYGGSATEVGAPLQQLDLAGLLGQIREHGAGDFYSGRSAQKLWDAAALAGIGINRDDWRNALPIAIDPEQRALGDHLLVTVPVARTSGTADTRRAESRMVVVDREGSAVACVFSMGRPYGSGRLVGGVFFPVAGAPEGLPALVTNKNTKILLAAIAGGEPAALAERTVAAAVPLDGALASMPGGGNAIVCSRGLPNYPESCQAGSDPAGHGLAALGDPRS